MTTERINLLPDLSGGIFASWLSKDASVLRELGRLAQFGVQMVYLTATLPPSKELTLYELANLRS